MKIKSIAPQLRTVDMASSIGFYTEKLGFSVEFNYEDFYAGIRAGEQVFHLKLVDEQDPSIPLWTKAGICIFTLKPTTLRRSPTG